MAILIWTEDGKAGFPTGRRRGGGLVHFFAHRVEPGVYFCEAHQEQGKRYAKITSFSPARGLKNYDSQVAIERDGFVVKSQGGFNYTETHTNAPIPTVVSEFGFNTVFQAVWITVGHAYSKESVARLEAGPNQFIMTGEDSLKTPPDEIIGRLATQNQKEKNVLLGFERSSSEEGMTHNVRRARLYGFSDEFIRHHLVAVANSNSYSKFAAKEALEKLGWL